MRFSTALFALPAFAASVLAQTAPATPATTGATQDHQISVGQNGLTFTPPQVTANPGDTVTFIFYPKNHTVTQSSFATPCSPLAGGTTSGFQPVAAGAASVPSMTITVNDTTPLWFYCQQTAPVDHCGSGMVFAVNPTAAKSFQSFQVAANATLPGAAATTGTNSTTAGTTGSTTGTTGTTGSTGNTGLPGSTTGNTGLTGSGVAAGAQPSVSTTTTGANASGALSISVRAGTVLAALGVAAGLLL